MASRWVLGVFAAGLAGVTVGVAACGGKVVLEGGNIGGEGGSSGQGTTTSTTGPGGPFCSWPDPVGEMFFCGGNAGAGGECAEVYCDSNGNQYEALCTEKACKCRYNGIDKCVCALNANGNFCNGTIPKCCPVPGIE